MESVLHFCERQQQRLHAAGQSSADAEAVSAPPSSPAGAAPPSTSSLSAPTTLAWLRMLCTDMLSSLYSANPGCLRAHMERQHLHSVALAAARPTKEPFVTTGRGKNKQKKQTVSEMKISARVTTALLFSAWSSVVAQFVLCPCFVCLFRLCSFLFVQSEQEEQHEWRVAEESMRVHMRSIDVHSCQRSLFVLLFNMMTDPNVRGTSTSTNAHE